MTETRRSAFARPARTTDAPTPTPRPALPAPGDVTRSIIDAAVERSGSLAALEAALRAEVAHFRACGSPSCPRRARPRAAYCRECLSVRRQTREGALVGSGWTPDPAGGGKRWIDPVTRESFTHAAAVRIAARDAVKGGAK